MYVKSTMCNTCSQSIFSDGLYIISAGTMSNLFTFVHAVSKAVLYTYIHSIHTYL